MSQSHIDVHSISPNKAAVVIDLSNYLQAFEKQDQTLYQSLYESIKEEVVGVNGQIIWQELLGKAIENFSPDERDIIYQSPACEMMNSSFVELLKNTMDEFILSNRSTPIRLELEVFLTDNRVQFVFKDTGRGFPNNFVDQMKTYEEQELYLLDTGSNKPSHNDKHPHLFGGAGRGLRILLAQANFGKDLIKGGILSPKYNLYPNKDYSQVTLSNRDDQQNGVQITLSSSLQPFEKWHEPDPSKTDFETSHLPNTIESEWLDDDLSTSSSTFSSSPIDSIPPIRKRAINMIADPVNSQSNNNSAPNKLAKIKNRLQIIIHNDDTGDNSEETHSPTPGKND